MDPLFPENFDVFVDVFGGAGWVSIKSPKASFASIIYNDFNPLLANVFECFRRDPDIVLNKMESIEKSDIGIYKKFQKELFVDTDLSTIELGDFDLAVKYLYLQTQIFAGTALSPTNVSYFTEVKTNGKYPSKYETLKKKLRDEKITKRLKKIDKVESLDCVDIIKKYDGENVFFYVDPPYYKKEFYYSRDFPREKHEELADALSKIKGKFALSYYDFDDLETFYPKDKFSWHWQTVYKSSATRSGNDEDYKQKSSGTEILIMNYD
jgi:DNA adenine methylase